MRTIDTSSPNTHGHSDTMAELRHGIERERVLQGGMLAALQGKGPEVLRLAVQQYEDDPDICPAMEQVRMNGYNICMAAVATGSASLFKRICDLGGKPFEIDEASGDSPLSVALFYMNRKSAGANEKIFKHLLEIGAMRQPSSYCMHDMIVAIWGAGIQTDKSSHFLQCAIDAGLDPMRPANDLQGGGLHHQSCPIQDLCASLNEKTVNCLAWLLDSGNIQPVDLLLALQIKDGVPAGLYQLDDDPQTANRLLGVAGKATALQSHTRLENATTTPEDKARVGPRF